MVDVKFWGPSGWDLFHALSLQSGKDDEKKQMFSVFQDILPCKYCRASTADFVKEMPPETDTAYWLYKIHDRVNKKLETQHLNNPLVPKPVPSPSFEAAMAHYRPKIMDPKLGWTFLYSVALNYNRRIHKKSSHKKFWIALKKLYPKQLKIPRLTNSREYFADVHSMLKDPEPLEKVYSDILLHKSKCVKKTCRKTHSRSRTRRSTLH